MSLRLIEDLVDIPQASCQSCRRLRPTGSDEMGAQECKSAIIHLMLYKLTVWQPDSPAASGSDMVHAQAIFAIIGAIALEKGSAVANQVTRERILAPLGLFGSR